MNLREMLKAPADQTVSVEVPGVGPVLVRKLKTRDILDLTKMPSEKAGLAMVVKAVVDEAGPVFSSIDQLMDMDWQTSQALVDACMSVNGLKNKLETAEKN